VIGEFQCARPGYRPTTDLRKTARTGAEKKRTCPGEPGRMVTLAIDKQTNEIIILTFSTQVFYRVAQKSKLLTQYNSLLFLSHPVYSADIMNFGHRQLRSDGIF